MLEAIIAIIVGLAIGGIGGYIVRKKSSESLIGSAEAEAQRILEAANRDIEALKKEALFKKKMPLTANLLILKRKKMRFWQKKTNWKKPKTT